MSITRSTLKMGCVDHGNGDAACEACVRAAERKRLLHQRGVETPCERCRGFGVIMYGSTATWRGGLGGAMCTRDVCELCWGSGDAASPWTDLRRLRNEEDSRVAHRAARFLAERCGVELRSLLPGLDELIDELGRFERQRRPRPEGFDIVCRCLASALRDMVAAKRAAMAAEPAR